MLVHSVITKAIFIRVGPRCGFCEWSRLFNCHLPLIWLPPKVTWDIFNVCLFTFNTFATPYLCSSDILNRFRKDGGRYFLCLLGRSLHDGIQPLLVLILGTQSSTCYFCLLVHLAR